MSRRAQLYLVSARVGPPLDYAEEWLRRHDLMRYFAGLYCTEKESKIEIAQRLDCKILIDVDRRHLKNPDAEILLILFEPSADAPIIPGPQIRVATSWEDATNISLEHLLRA